MTEIPGKFVDYIIIRGFEYRRSDTPPILRNFQSKIFDIILSDLPISEITEQIQEEIDKTISVFKNAAKDKTLIQEIAFPKGISENIDNYGRKDKNGNNTGVPPQIRGALIANEFFGTNFQKGSKIKMIYIKKVGLPRPVVGSNIRMNTTDVLSFDDISQIINAPFEWELDVKKMVETCITRKIQFLPLIGINVSASTSGIHGRQMTF